MEFKTGDVVGVVCNGDYHITTIATIDSREPDKLEYKVFVDGLWCWVSKVHHEVNIDLTELELM